MKRQGLWVFLLCLVIAKTIEGSPRFSPDPPLGLYYSRFWFDVDKVLIQSPLQRMFDLEKKGFDIYESSESWVTPGFLFMAFYSSSTKLLTGAWRSTEDDTWGAINYHWNGVTFSGVFSTYGSNATGYEIMHPVDDGFVVPQASGP